MISQFPGSGWGAGGRSPNPRGSLDLARGRPYLSGVIPRPKPSPPSGRRTYEDFQATALFCSHCGAAQPVRERLLLVLPDGELHEYLCAACGTSVGSRKLGAPPPRLIP